MVSSSFGGSGKRNAGKCAAIGGRRQTGGRSRDESHSRRWPWSESARGIEDLRRQAHLWLGEFWRPLKRDARRSRWVGWQSLCGVPLAAGTPALAESGFQRGAIPVREVGGSGIGGLAKLEQRRRRRRRLPHRFVIEQELAELRAVARLRRTHRGFAEAGRLGRGIGVEDRRFHAAAAASRPEPHAPDLMGIGLAGDGVGAGPRGRAPAGEARYRQVEAAPEKMHGTAFADEAGTEALKDAGGGAEDGPQQARD